MPENEPLPLKLSRASYNELESLIEQLFESIGELKNGFGWSGKSGDNFGWWCDYDHMRRHQRRICVNGATIGAILLAARNLNESLYPDRPLQAYRSDAEPPF